MSGGKKSIGKYINLENDNKIEEDKPLENINKTNDKNIENGLDKTCNNNLTDVESPNINNIN